MPGKQDEWLDGLDEKARGKEARLSGDLPCGAGSSGKRRRALCRRHPELTLVSNAKAFAFLDQFTAEEPISMPRRVVAEGDTLELGEHTLHFVMAPMVHWPEVMVEYEEKEKVLFSADGFGNFGGLTYTPDWEMKRAAIMRISSANTAYRCEGLLKKAAALEIASVCPLHGPQLSGDALRPCAGAVRTLGGVEAGRERRAGCVCQLHGHTAEAAKYMAKCLEELGEKVELIDLNRAFTRAMRSAPHSAMTGWCFARIPMTGRMRRWKRSFPF